MTMINANKLENDILNIKPQDFSCEAVIDLIEQAKKDASDKKVVILKYEDWEGLYLDGKCVLQDHRIFPMDMLIAIKLYFNSDTKLNQLVPDVWYADEDWAEEAGKFPEDWKDVKVRF